MSTLFKILAAGSLARLALAVPIPSSSPLDIATLARRFTYVTYFGNGEPSDGWPTMDDWISDLDTMYELNKQTMSESCAQFGVTDDSDSEMSDIKSAVQSVSDSTGVDARFIFAIMMQESNGCVRAPTTNGGVRNPGLMQDHDGTYTCNDDGDIQDPCPASEITGMINDGTAGTSSGDGLVQCIEQSDASDVSKYYKAARIYNSGSIASSGDLGEGIATHCYASDIANRLTGWATGVSTCCLNDGCTSDSSSSSSSSSSDSSSSSTEAATTSTTSTSSVAVEAATTTSTPATSTQAAATTEAPVATTTSVAETYSTTTTTSVITTTMTRSGASSTVTNEAPLASENAKGVETATSTSSATATATSAVASADLAPGVTTECAEYYTIQVGDYCDKVADQFDTTFAELRTLNVDLDAACSNLWLGYAYCVKSL